MFTRFYVSDYILSYSICQVCFFYLRTIITKYRELAAVNFSCILWYTKWQHALYWVCCHLNSSFNYFVHFSLFNTSNSQSNFFIYNTELLENTVSTTKGSNYQAQAPQDMTFIKPYGGYMIYQKTTGYLL